MTIANAQFFKQSLFFNLPHQERKKRSLQNTIFKDSLSKSVFQGEHAPKRHFFEIINHYEKGITLTFGKPTSILNPGLVFLMPWIQRLEKVDTRAQIKHLPEQSIVTCDEACVKVSALVTYSIRDVEKALLHVKNLEDYLPQICTSEMQSALSAYTAYMMVYERKRIEKDLLEALQKSTSKMGIQMDHFEISKVFIDKTETSQLPKKTACQKVFEGRFGKLSARNWKNDL